MMSTFTALKASCTDRINSAESSTHKLLVLNALLLGLFKRRDLYYYYPYHIPGKCQVTQFI